MIQIIMLALFVEAIVSAIKPLWKDGGKGLTVTEIVSIVIGVVMAVAMRIDLFSYFADVEMYWDSPAWVKYIFYVMSGVALGRGPSFIYDLWDNIKKWADMKITEGVTLEEVKTVEALEKLVEENAEEPKEAAQETEESACNGKDWCDLDENGNAIQEAPQSVNE